MHSSTDSILPPGRARTCSQTPPKQDRHGHGTTLHASDGTNHSRTSALPAQSDRTHPPHTTRAASSHKPKRPITIFAIRINKKSQKFLPADPLQATIFFHSIIFHAFPFFQLNLLARPGGVQVFTGDDSSWPARGQIGKISLTLHGTPHEGTTRLRHCQDVESSGKNVRFKP